MKTKIIMCFLLTTLNFGNNITAQTSIKKMVKEKTINGTTYVLEQCGTERVHIKNKNGKYDQLTKKWGKYCTDFYLTDQNALSKDRKDIVKSVFSDARIKQLSGDDTNNITLNCICNRDGEIKAVWFLGVKSSIITISEINALENALLKMKVGLDSHLCPDTKYFLFHFPIRFKDNL